jgi:hypothetical protein
MSTTSIVPHILDESRAAFILGPVSINVASCNANLVPSVARAYGCRVVLAQQKVTVFLAVARSRALLQDLRSGGAIAITFSRPKTHQTMQLKGRNAEVTPLRPNDRDVISAHSEAFCDEICALGYPDHFAQAMRLSAVEDVLSVSFIPTEAFEQSPGTAAGLRLEAVT